MNLVDPRAIGEFNDMVGHLGLTSKNREILTEYLLTPDCDDSILAGCEEQNNFHSIAGNYVSYAFVNFLRMESVLGIQAMDRFLRFLWAVGGASVCNLMCKTWHGEIHGGDTPRFRAAALGNVRTAAMEAVGAFAPHTPRGSLRWLCQTAQEHPQDLVAALSYCQDSRSIGYGLLSGLLLRFAPELAPPKDAILQNVEDGIRKILFSLPMGEVQAMIDYVAAGDPAAPMPIPAGIPYPAVDVESAMRSFWTERMYFRTYGFAALMGAEENQNLRCLLKMILMINPKSIVQESIEHLSKDVLALVMPTLRHMMPGGGTTVVCLAMERSPDDRGNQKLLLDLCREDIPSAMIHCTAEQYSYLIGAGMDPLPVPQLREKLTKSFCILRDPAEAPIITAFLNTDGDLKDANIRLAAALPARGTVSIGCMHLLREYIDSEGLDPFAVRCCALAGLLFSDPNLGTICWLPKGKRNYELLCQVMDKLCQSGLDPREVLQICARQNEASIYLEDVRAACRKAALSLAQPGRAWAFADVHPKGDLFLRGVAVEASGRLAQEKEAKQTLLAALADSAKQIREQASRILMAHPEWTADYKELLKSKKTAVRLLAVEILGRIGEKAPLEAALQTEKNAKVADAIRDALGAENAAAVGSAEDLAANLLKGNKRKKLQWLLEQPLTGLRKADGTEAGVDVRDAILLSYCELGRIGRSDTAAELSNGLDAGDLQKLAAQVYDYWFAAGAQAKQKWVLPFAAVYGGTSMTQRLTKAIHDWPEQQRGAIACDAVMALALSSDPAALVIVDGLSRKFKFRQIKVAAAAALENAASELGISAEELADRIVPDLGFGKDGKRVFDYGKRSFTVRLTPTLELSIVNDQGKAVKSMPAPGKTDDPMANDAYEEFKAMKKGIKTTVSAQRSRLELALSVLRCWDVERWKQLFVENPIMHQFAMSLVWGIYADGKLTDTFRYMEDGTFNTVDEEEYELPENAKIGLVHPVELDEETLQGWKQQLEDYEITQSIEQLHRPVHRLSQEKAGEKALEDFGGKMLNSLSLSGKLLGMGWYRGSIVDGGGFMDFYREDATLGIGAELRFSGGFVGYDEGEDVTVYDAVFYTGTIRRGSYVYDQVPDEQILSLGQVPARYYSEIILQLEKATASSRERNENWKQDRK